MPLASDLQPGDCLVEVNGQDVFRHDLNEIRDLILGDPGTTVRLGLHRGTDPRAPLIQVALQRSAPGAQMAGVGIVFRSDHTGALFVRMLQEGGAAQKSGEIGVGDCIVEVDGVDVYRKPISTFTNLMLGPPGTMVTIGLKKGDREARPILRLAESDGGSRMNDDTCAKQQQAGTLIDSRI
jgi:C-terminal processing protease CtpA/Prc